MGQRELNRVREIALALPAVNERLSHGALCFFIDDKVPLCYYHDHHSGDGRISLWCPAYPELQAALVRSQPLRFFKPETSSAGTFANWLGMFLDASDENEVDWQVVSAVLNDAYRKVAPKKLVAKLTKRSPARK